MKKFKLLVAVTVCLAASSVSAFEYQNVEKRDPSCEKSMRLVKKKFGKPDEVLQLSSNSISIIYRKKQLHFTFEVQGNACVVTSSDF